MFVVAYAHSPIDLIPDFIPVLGYIDDVLLLPGVIYLAIRLLPPDILVESSRQAEAWISSAASKPRSMSGAALIIGMWVAIGLTAWIWFMPRSMNGSAGRGRRPVKELSCTRPSKKVVYKNSIHQ